MTRDVCTVCYCMVNIHSRQKSCDNISPGRVFALPVLIVDQCCSLSRRNSCMGAKSTLFWRAWFNQRGIMKHWPSITREKHNSVRRGLNCMQKLTRIEKWTFPHYIVFTMHDCKAPYGWSASCHATRGSQPDSGCEGLHSAAVQPFYFALKYSKRNCGRNSFGGGWDKLIKNFFLTLTHTHTPLHLMQSD